MDFSCHTIYPVHVPIVQVKHWKTKENVVDFFFMGTNHSSEVRMNLEAWMQGQPYEKSLLEKTLGENYIRISHTKKPHFVFESLYQDDTIYTLLLKLIAFISLEEGKILPYVWSEQTPLRFRFLKNLWKGYHVNPFLANLKEPAVLPEVQTYSDKIMSFQILEIATFQDVSTFFAKTKGQGLKYYFPNEKDTYRTTDMQTATYEQTLLHQLWNTPRDAHQTMIKQSSCSYIRALFQGTLETKIPYKQFFEKFSTQKRLPFLQFYDDMNHVYYKVYKKHTIPVELFQEWTNPEFFTNQHSVTLYSFLKEKSMSYMKLFIDATQQVHITYRLDASENVAYSQIHEHLQFILQEIENLTGVRIQTTMDRLALKTTIGVRDVVLKSLSAYFTKLPAIFHVPSKNRISKNILDMQFKRVEKYGESRNIIDFIKSKLELEIPLIELIQELQEYGVDEEEVREYVDQIQRAEQIPVEKKKKRNFKNVGLILHIHPISLGLQIYIDNASSFLDMQNALFWIRSAVYMWQQNQTLRKTILPPPTLPPQEVSPVSPEAGPSIPFPPAFGSPTGSELSFASSSASSGLSLPGSIGGAIGKKHQRLFKNMLEKLDPDIFAKTENYARKCGISDLRQPVGMTLEQKKKIDEMGYQDGYDNFLVYGSDPQNPNVYMCPKIYCPQSQIPLSHEKYVANGNKCPDPEEEPILLYTTSSWYNDPTRAHYVGFLKERGYNQLQLPCCFKKPQAIEKPSRKKSKGKEPESQPESRRETKPGPEEGYIMDKIRPLQEGRYGTIPASLHEFLYEGVPYTLCKNTVKSKECVLRQGIRSAPDSLMESIAYLLGVDGKADLVRQIRERLDPFTFLTLENGKVYTYFLPKKPLLPELHTEKRKLLRSWLESHPAYVRRFQLEELLPLLDKSLEGVSKPLRYKIARQLMIHASYQAFLEYLDDDELKNPYLLMDMLYHIGVLLLVWNRDSQNIATLRCPYTTKNKQWYDGQKNIPYIMVMQQETYYEPLVIVDQHRNITQRISFTRFEKLQRLLSTCPAMMAQEDALLQDIYTLTKWIEGLLASPESFALHTLLLNPQDQVIGCFLQNHLYIEFPIPLSTFSLQQLVERCSIPHICYWEDVQRTTLDIRAPVADLRLIQTKLKALGFGLRIGTLREQTDTTIVSMYTIPKVVYPEPPKLPLLLQDKFIRVKDMLQHNREEWYQTKKTMLQRLLESYDTWVSPLLKEPPLTQLKKLHAHFADIEEPSRTAVLLEEMPYWDRTLLQQMYDQLIFDRPYYHKDDKIYEGRLKKEWIFTQKAVQQKQLQDVLYPTRIQRPKGEPKVDMETIQNRTIPEMAPRPSMLDIKKLTEQPIPSKWRSQFWSKYSIGVLPSYSARSFLETMEWIAHQQGIRFSVEDLLFYLRKQVYLMLDDPSSYELLLEDPVMRSAWNKAIGRKYRTLRELEQGLLEKTMAERKELWKQASTYLSGNVQDLDMYNISKLLRCSFLLLQKGKDLSSARGNIQELVAASKFIQAHGKHAWTSTPLFVFYKQLSEDKTHTIYSILVSTKDKEPEYTYYSQGQLAPLEIRKLIQQHLS